MKRLALSIISISLGALLASGCVYKMNVQQGNFLVTESVAQLKEGMTRSQVRFLLGTPMVPDAFDESRWDYYYFMNNRKFDKPLQRRLTVYFEDEKVQRIENQGVPTQTDLDQLERDLKRAIEANRNNTKQPFWKKVFGKDDADTEPEAAAGTTTTTEPPAPKNSAEAEAQAPPDPVPPPSSLPAPAGMPSGQP
jgi:outer membrane protein assembly factor BamE